MLPGRRGVNVALRALALALLARWRAPGNCVIPPASRDAVARRTVADYVGRDMGFRHFVEDAAAGELRATHQVPLAILASGRRGLYEGVGSRVMPLYAGQAGMARGTSGSGTGRSRAGRHGSGWPGRTG